MCIRDSLLLLAAGAASVVVVVYLSCRTSKATTTTTNSTTTFRGGVSVHAVRGRWWSPQSVVARPYSKTNPPSSYHTRLFFLCAFRYKNPEILLSSLLCYIKRGKRESRASPPPPPKKAMRVTCVWKVLAVVVRSFVFARCWSSRGFYTATERIWR